MKKVLIMGYVGADIVRLTKSLAKLECDIYVLAGSMPTPVSVLESNKPSAFDPEPLMISRPKVYDKDFNIKTHEFFERSESKFFKTNKYNYKKR